jgi:O-succinylbenzoic acid--CoA ligase
MVTTLWDEGRAVLPLDPRLPAAEVRRVLETARPTHISSEDGIARLGSGRPVSEGAAVVLLTSGTSGRPKAVELGHTALRSAAAASHHRLGVGPEDRWLCCLPVHHIAGFGIVVRSLLLGADPLFAASTDLEAIAGSEANLVSLVPLMLARLLDDGADLTGFKAVLLGGGAIPADLIERASAAGVRVVRTYGMTETCGGVVYEGVPLEGTSIRIDPLPGAADGRGRIAINSPSLMTGYRSSPGEGGSRIEDGWLLTSDEGSMADGKLVVHGRLDDVIITGGEKVSASEVRAAVLAHPGIAFARIVGRSDKRWGERVVAVIVPAPGGPPTLAQLKEFLAPTLARHKLPKELTVVEYL